MNNIIDFRELLQVDDYSQIEKYLSLIKQELKEVEYDAGYDKKLLSMIMDEMSGVSYSNELDRKAFLNSISGMGDVDYDNELERKNTYEDLSEIINITFPVEGTVTNIKKIIENGLLPCVGEKVLSQFSK